MVIHLQSGRPRPPGDSSSTDVEIVPMRRRHLRSVLAIEELVFPRPWTYGLFLSELGLPATRAYVVARAGRQVVGYAGLMCSVGDGHVTTIGVDPEWQRRKIATRLLLRLAEEGLARQCTQLTLEVRMSNHGAQRLYHAFGFAPAGVRKNYYAEVNEDALVMWAHDVDSPAYAARLAAIAAGLADEGAR